MATILRTRAVIAGESGLPGLTTFYWLDPSPTAGNATAALAGVRAYFEAAKAYLSNGATVSYDTAVDVLNDGTGGLVSRLTATSQTQTTSTGSSDAPPANQLGVKLNTSTVVNGRVLPGRSFFGPCTPDAFGSGGQIGSGARTALLAAGAALLAVSAVDLAVWHRPVNGAGGIAVACTGIGVADKVWVLRSRRD